jgi:hypothetical protein
MSSIKSWNQRPSDVANLFNPAFCAAIVNRVAAGYSKASPAGLPFSLAFIALPVLLHPPSADELPTTSRTNFHGWLLENPQALIGFAERAQSMAPFVREGITYGLVNNILQLNDLRLLPCSQRQLKLWEKEAYNLRYSHDSQLLGKLLGQLNDLTTVFAFFGIRP